jgi:hypothetical protein
LVLSVFVLAIMRFWISIAASSGAIELLASRIGFEGLL